MQKGCSNVPFRTGLIFSLAISFMAALFPPQPAAAENYPVCVGGAAFAGAVKIGNRLFPPQTILRADTNCLPGETRANLVAVTRTLVVSPGGTPQLSGDNLLNALQTITPTAATRWLLKLEPGVYDLGTRRLDLPSYLDIEGSGENSTIISTSVSSVVTPTFGAVNVGSYSELRFLSVYNQGTGGRAGIFVVTNTVDVRLHKVTARISAGTPDATQTFGAALFNANGQVEISNSRMYATGLAAQPGTTAIAAVINIGANAYVTVTDSTLSGEGLAYQSFGLSNQNGVVTVQDSILNASANEDATALFDVNYPTTVATSRVRVVNTTLSGDGRQDSYGLYTVAGNASVENSNLSTKGSPENNVAVALAPNPNNPTTLTAVVTVSNSILNSNGGFFSAGISNTNGTVTVQNSSLNATGANQSGTPRNIGISTFSLNPVTVHNSTIRAIGTGASQDFALARQTVSIFTLGTANIGASQLAGTDGIATNFASNLKCVASYDLNFNPLSSVCTGTP
jgi:hypothetical protein